MNSRFITDLNETQKEVFEKNKKQLEKIFNDEGLTMKCVSTLDDKFVISANPINADEKSQRISKKIEKELGIKITICL